MRQQRLNNFMLLHVHTKPTDLLNTSEIANKPIMEFEHRIRVFDKFQ